MEHHRNVNNRHSINGMEAMSAANQINGNKKRFSVSDVSDMLYEFYRANSAAKAPKTENTDKSFRQKSPSSADAAAGGKSGSMQSGMPNEPQTSNTSTASKNSNGDEMTNTNNKIGTTKSSISVRKNTSSFHPRVKYSSVVNKSSAAAAAAAAAALANMENTPAAIPTSVVVPPPDIKPILPIPASVIKAPIVGGATAAPAAAAIAAALLRDGYHNFQQQLRNQDIFKQQSNLVPLAHNNQSGGSVQPISGQSKSLTFDSFDRKENRFSENDNDSNSEFDEDDDDDDDDDGRYSGFDDIHLIEGSKSSFNNHPNATMPCLSTDYMSDESQKLMMAAQAQALRHLEYSLSDYGGTNPNEEANYQCRHCGKKYRWKSTLRRHENVECGGKEPAHQCPYCAYKSKQRGNLGVHVRKHHSNLPQLASKRRSKYSQQREVKIEKTEKAF
ncbi:longitudinals lacking protein [Episyrphus balteatus]|uniref:longitudinals lacking protein n=1 Tax=Episyrphus balteatus TaxID=286459 RepID=UPI0024853A6F|nr:longitudinals lacking protein [Episyrphus balteatus]